MPVKELKQPCTNCKDAEFEITVRQKNLCQYATIYNPSNREILTSPGLATKASLAKRSLGALFITDPTDETMRPISFCFPYLMASPRRF